MGHVRLTWPSKPSTARCLPGHHKPTCWVGPAHANQIGGPARPISPWANHAVSWRLAVATGRGPWATHFIKNFNLIFLSHFVLSFF